MILILAFIISLQLVAGQSLWKRALGQSHFHLGLSFLLSRQALTFFLQPLFLGGALLYVSSTLFYMAILQKYPLYSAQTAVVSLGLILSFILSAVIFHERASLHQLAGLILLVGGMYLVLKP